MGKSLGDDRYAQRWRAGHSFSEENRAKIESLLDKLQQQETKLQQLSTAPKSLANTTKLLVVEKKIHTIQLEMARINSIGGDLFSANSLAAEDLQAYKVAIGFGIQLAMKRADAALQAIENEQVKLDQLPPDSMQIAQRKIVAAQKQIGKELEAIQQQLDQV